PDQRAHQPHQAARADVMPQHATPAGTRLVSVRGHIRVTALHTTVGIAVENNRVHVDYIWRSPTVHGLAPRDARSSRLSSTASDAMDASVDGARTLSSPASTVAKTTDESL